MLMVNATNTYANNIIAANQVAGTHREGKRLYQWVDVSIDEMKKFWSILINMGLARRKRLESYWSTAFNMFQPFYSKTMSLRRFQLILSMFQVSARVSPPRGEPGYDPWVKVREFFDSLTASFRHFFVPNQEICIDESMIGMKNRCIFIQYMPNKRHSRFGIKKFELCDSKTGYVLDSIMYSGRDFLAQGNVAFTQKVVMELMSRCNLLGKRYHLFTDNYYTKMPLARLLYQNKSYLTGTVNKRSKELSKTVLQAKLGVGESVYFRKGNDNILLLKYKQKASRKPVHLITTACRAENHLVQRGNMAVNKPMVIHRYNQHMGGVDSKDKSVYHTTCSRQTKKYWKKIVFNFADMALLNAYQLYKSLTQNPMSRYAFMNAIVLSLINRNPEEQPMVAQPVPDVGEGHALTPNNTLRLCEVCRVNNKKSRSKSWCPGCNVGVHVLCYVRLEHYPRQRFQRAHQRGNRPEPQEDEEAVDDVD
jgi:hypothetical protein